LGAFRSLCWLVAARAAAQACGSFNDQEFRMRTLQGVALCVAVAMSGGVWAQDCAPEQRVKVQAGQFGALNAEAFDALNAALQAKDQAAVSALVAQKLVQPLPAGAMGCLRASGPQRKQLVFAGEPQPLWVADAALSAGS
jgi:hypothetical protein